MIDEDLNFSRSLLRNRIGAKTAFFLNGFVYASWGARLPRIQELHHADNGEIGLVLLFMSLGAVGAMPFAGWLIARIGSRVITSLSAILYCVFVALIPFASPLAALTILFVLTGIANGMLDVAMNTQAVMVEREYRRPIMTSFHAFFSIGMALGAWLASYFASRTPDLSAHLTIACGGSLALAIWTTRNLIHDKPEGLAVSDGPLFRIPARHLLGAGMIAFCCMIGEGAISDWSVNYMENVAKSTKGFAPLALSGFGTAMTLGRLFGDSFRARWGDALLITTGGVIASTGMGMALIAPFPYVCVAGFFLVGAGLSTIVPITYSIAGNAPGLPSGTGLAMVTTVGYSGFLFGPPIIGFLADSFNLRIALLLIAALFVVMTLLGYFAVSRRRTA